jgi:NitT/TauT family transport system substrate-binding protein
MIRRRDFLRVWGAGAGALLGIRAERADAEPPPETKKLTLALTTSICQAPQYVAESLLKAEGFTDIRYAPVAGLEAQALSRGEIDLTLTFAGPVLLHIDAGDPVVLLGGGHVGCLELFGNDRVRAIRDLKGKTVLVYALNNPAHVFLAIAMAHVGLDPRKDVTLVTRPPAEAIAAFEKGEVDAIAVAPPVTQEMRARRLGRVVVDTAKDRPWSQYFCCMVVGHREFVRKYPVATRRAMRAILKSTDLCALEPERAARTLVDRGFATRYESAAQTMKELPYRAWRDYVPEDTVRFYALRLHEAGMIKSSPQKILAQGTDWRFFNELKKELKG